VVDLFVKSHTKIEQPRWLKIDEMPGPIVRFDPSNKPSTHRIVPIGANMAFRRVVFERYGNFRTDMGPTALLSVERRIPNSAGGCCEVGKGSYIRQVQSSTVRLILKG
jgi:hypothetical protein